MGFRNCNLNGHKLHFKLPRMGSLDCLDYLLNNDIVIAIERLEHYLEMFDASQSLF